jgi:CDP-diacylglycerol--glycerol-3-phosphate 3-phosphatidyltransferase
VHVIAIIAVYFMATVSIISATDYFVAFWRKIERASVTRRETFIMSRKKDVSTVDRFS